MKTITTSPEFLNLTEEDVSRALDEFEADDDNDDVPSDPVVAEVARLIAAYADRFDQYCEQYAELPPHVLEYEPPSPIEQIAFGIFTDAVFDAFQDADDE